MLSSCKLLYNYEDCFLSREERRTLNKLIQIFKCRRLAARYKRLIRKLEIYLRKNLKNELNSLFKVYKSTVTEEIIDVIKEKKTLRLTDLINRFQQKQSDRRYNFNDEFENYIDYINYEREDK